MLAVLACQPAFASGGVHCSADAQGVAFEVGGGASRGMGAALFSFEGRLVRPGDDGEGMYDGDYTLTVFDMTEESGGGVTVNREGQVECFVE